MRAAWARHSTEQTALGACRSAVAGNLAHLAQLRFHWPGFFIHMTTKHRIYTTPFASVYPLYVAKVERKGRTKAELDAVIGWLTGYQQKELEELMQQRKDFETFFAAAPKMNPARALVKGVVCGVRVEDIQEPTMREIRYLDKLVDELAKGRAMDKILRS